MQISFSLGPVAKCKRKTGVDRAVISPLQLTVIIYLGKIYIRIITTGIESKHKDFYTSGGPLNNFRIYTKKRKIYMTSAYVERDPQPGQSSLQRQL